MSEENKNIRQEPRYEIDETTQQKIFADHEYDGIREFDNDLPTWWRYLFYFCILFAAGYLMKYHVFKAAPLQYEEYASEYEHEEDTSAQVSLFAASNDIDKPKDEPYSDEENLKEGYKIFQKNCAVCHLSKGEGLVGPNLTDDYWIHGGKYTDITHTIIEGVPVKGMISWKNQLTARQIEQVASYVTTLRGTNPPNAKSPEGEKYVPGS